MTVTEEIRTLAIERASAERIAEVAVRQGMRRLREDGLEKVRQGRTSIAEICRVTSSGTLSDRTPSDVVRRLKERGRTSDTQGDELRLRRSCSWTSWRAAPPTCTSPPARRRWSASAAASCGVEGYPRLSPTDTREIVYSILTNDQRQRLETDWQLDFAYSVPGHARFRVNAYFQRSAIGAAFRLIPADIVPHRRPRPAAGRPRLHQEAARHRARHRARPARASPPRWRRMIDEINETREEHIMTIEDPIEFLHGHKKCIVNQRELGSDAAVLRAGPEGRAAPGPRRDPRRRDARPGDDLDRADRGRDRPPRLRDAAHAGRAADDRPHHRRLPAHQQGQVRVQLSVAPPGRHDPAAAADGRRLGPRRGLRGARARPRPCAT